MPRTSRAAHILERPTPMAHSDPTADAFLRRILANPADATPRLVFADWLEETGTASNVAWAHYLRLADELANLPSEDTQRAKLTATLKQFGSRICAKLTLRAEELLADLVAVRLLLPLRNFTLKLSRLQLPPAVLACVPESVAYENCTLPLHVSSQSVVLAMSYTQRDLCHELGFILNRAVEPVLAPAAQLQAAIVRHYGSAEYQFVDAVLLDYAPTYRELPPRTPYPIDGGTSINRLINTLLSEAIRIRATALELEPFATETGSGVHLWHHIDGWRIEDAPFPVWLLPRIAFRMRVLADIPIREGEVDIGQIPCSYHGTRYRLPVRINPTQHGPHIHIDIPSVSPNPAASARVPTA